MPICKLCHKERQLRDSHIVPEFLYNDLYNDKHQMMGITGRGHKGWAAVQKGLREQLFCEECEQHFNESFEKPFCSQWIIAKPLPNPWNTEETFWISVDYTTFKLFHLSVLFRAGVSTLPTYTEVQLGPHQDRLREMILNCNPGNSEQYPLFGRAVIHHKTQSLISTISKIQKLKIEGHTCYGMMYGGVEWWISVSSHHNPGFISEGLQTNGHMPFVSVNWNDTFIMQEAANALRNPEV